MAQVGRISGPLLEANLIRNGIDLAFRNDLNTTQLLYLDVNTGRIAVNNNASAVELDVIDTEIRTVNLISNESNTASIANYSIGNNTIEVLTGDIFLNANEAIVLSNLETEQFYATDNTISTKDTNTDIELRPNGTGTLEVYNNLNIFGNLSTPGNITLEGTITFGDTLAQDTIDFNADVNSDIIPDITNTYSLGSSTKRWNTLYTNFINGQTVSTDEITAGGTLLNSRAGNIFYVATNGNDANVGDHIQGPLATIREALSRADASTSGPVVVYVLPGEYQEELPLVVPTNVSVVGHNIRNVIITPDTSSQTQDVFHLNGESTVQDLTIKDFYYDDINNTGYAFRFAPNAVISTRSPYIQNISVITHGTNIEESDPRGFNSGDAGKGAYINGAEMNSASFDASMLFHSCTFITPGVDAITMTNGVRVEWLNGFTYFADRGLYAVDGLTGRTGQDGSTVIYGAELRSIGSANVYGNYGAVADGAGTLMYLIQHNMAYIGTGANAENDPSLAIQANEILESNSGQIHYVTTDHTGSFRIGDNFFIDFETGSTSVDLSSLTADSLTGLVITNAGDTTTINGRFIETGNFRIIGNLIQSLSGDINLDSATNTTNLNNNTNINGTLDITGNFTFDGALSLAGNESDDAVTFNVELEQDFNPNETMAFKLGSPSKKWLAAYLNRIEVGDFSIYDNVIETKTSNADLEIRANGTGNILIPDSATVDNGLSIAEISSFADVNITGTLSLTGNLDIAGNKIISNDLTISQNLTVGASAQFEEILVDGNVITTTSSNADLELRASGTGNIVVSQDVVAEQDLSFDNGSFGNNLTVDLNLTADNTNISNIEINDNYIETTSVDADLELKSTQNISTLDSVELGRDLSVTGTTDLQSLTITGLLDHTGDRVQTGNYTVAGELTVDSIYIEDNFITSNGVDQDLELSADVNANILVPTNNVNITNNLSVAGTSNLQSISVTGSLLHTGNKTQTGNYDLAGELTVDNIYVEDNFITSTGADQDLILSADGAGIVTIPSNNLQISNELLVSEITDLQNVTITGTISQIGDTIQSGNKIQTGNTSIIGGIDVSSLTQFENIQINGNVLQTVDTNSNLELRASGTGKIVVNDNLRVSNDLFVASITSSNIVIDQDLNLNEIVIPPSIIEINDNYISTKISNADLDLRANANGVVRVPDNNVTFTNALDVNGVTNLSNSIIVGTLTQLGTRIQTGNYDLTEDLTTSGTVLVSARSIIDDISISGNKLESTTGNLVLEASGSGNVVFSDLFAGQNLSSGTLVTEGIIIDGTFALEELESSTDIQIFDNVITTTNSNSNLELRANGTGDVILQELRFNQNSVATNSTDITISPTENLIVNSTGSLKVPLGPETVLSDSGEFRFNSDTGSFEGYNSGRISFNGVYSDDRRTSVLAHPTNNTLLFTINSVLVGSINDQQLSIHGLQVEDILINNNSISTTVSNSDLELRTAGNGIFIFDNVNLVNNTIDTTASSLVFSNTENGYTKLAGTFGVVVPTGSESERPVLDPEVGDTRFNTDDEVLEVWDGSTYVAAAGTSATISQTEFNDLMFEFTLIFG